MEPAEGSPQGTNACFASIELTAVGRKFAYSVRFVEIKDAMPGPGSEDPPYTL